MSNCKAIESAFITLNSNGETGEYNVNLKTKTLKDAQKAHMEIMSIIDKPSDGFIMTYYKYTASINGLLEQIKTMNPVAKDDIVSHNGRRYLIKYIEHGVAMSTLTLLELM